MKKIYKSLLIGLIGLLLVSTELFAQIPGIAIQGVLRDPNGRTVDDGFYSVAFKLYDAATGGTELWTETQSSLQTRNGLFATKLGSVNAIQGLPFDAPYYLGIAVEGRAELTPRMELTISPYALGIMGQDNKFPSVGDVEIKTNLSVQEGNVTVGQGDMTLSGGNFNITAGEVVISDPSSGIRFSDGTFLNTALGGTAANVANPNSVIVSADTDTDGTGNVELQIGIDSKMTVHNDGVVSMQSALKLDSGQVMTPNGKTISIGHFNPADSTYTERMNIAADGTTTFNGKVKASGTPTENDDLVPLSELNAVKAQVENLKSKVDSLSSRIGGDPNDQLLDSLNAGRTAAEMLAAGFTPRQVTDVYGKGRVLGLDYYGGKIFELVGDVTYLVYGQTIQGMYKDYQKECFPTQELTSAFGYGAYNFTDYFTQLCPTVHTASNTFTQLIQNNAYGGYSDWYIPSIEEIERVADNLEGSELPSGFINNDQYSSSFVRQNPGSSSGNVNYVRFLDYRSDGNHYISWTNTPLDYWNSSTFHVPLVRRVYKAGTPIPLQTSAELQEAIDSGADGSLTGIPEVATVDNIIGNQMAGGTVFATAGGYAYIATVSAAGYTSANGWSIPLGNYGAFGTGYENGVYQSYDNWVASAGELEEVINNTNLIEDYLNTNPISTSTYRVLSSTLQSNGNVWYASFDKSGDTFSFSGFGGTLPSQTSPPSLIVIVRRKPLNKD